MQDIAEQLSRGPRIRILVGEFGSGKTELAVNYALKLKEQGYNTAVVDIDLIKPYFRTRENRALLETRGVTVVAPDPRLSHVDLPILPQDLTRVLYTQDCQVVMDVGGGESSIALGQLAPKFADNPYQAMLVVNTCRPFTSTVEGIAEVRSRIESVSRLKITSLISNANLARETDEKLVLDGLAVVEQAAEKLGLPISWVVVPAWLEGKISVPYPVFPLTPYTQYPWMA